jgi:hypothetical protein
VLAVADARGGRGCGRVRGLGVEAKARKMVGCGASRRYCAHSRSARVAMSGGVAAVAILVIRAAGPHLSFYSSA